MSQAGTHHNRIRQTLRLQCLRQRHLPTHRGHGNCLALLSRRSSGGRYRNDPRSDHFRGPIVSHGLQMLNAGVQPSLSLSAANEYAANDQRISEGYRSTLKEGKIGVQYVHEVFGQWKAKYDRRLKSIAALPMKHRIVPVKPAFPMASTAFTPAANGHIATTVYPEERELSNGTTGVQHWMVITIEAEHRRILDPVAEAMATAARQTLTNDQASVDWTVRRVTEDGELGTYANPSHYSIFRKEHPAASQQIERHIPDTIVVDQYERHIGPALYLAR